ncbi:MAG: hypothetical protein IJ689_01655 [Alphaproteobacteria bacterium]|nr:hypothetical protein [Alphaproteobacteria bacterium]
MLKRILNLAAIAVMISASASAQTTQTPNLNAKVSVFDDDFDFEHKQYYQCTSQILNGSAAGYIGCLNAELKRQDDLLKYFYTELLKQPQYQKWNNGNGLFKGNIKDMNDQYAAYRDRICSMFAMGMMNFYQNIEWGRKDCMMQTNDELLRRMQRFYSESLADYSSELDLELSARD